MSRRDFDQGAAGQSGVALVMALLVVAIAALLAYGMSSQALIDVTRANTLARSEESRQLALGMEDWAMAILHQQMLSDQGYDSRLQPWASPLPPMPVQGGTVTGQIDDLNGRFNLNSLLKPGEGGRDPLAMERFSRLLAVLELPPSIADAVADWIDPDTSVQGAGAEDLDYLRLDPPYRAANRPMARSRVITGLVSRSQSTKPPVRSWLVRAQTCSALRPASSSPHTTCPASCTA